MTNYTLTLQDVTKIFGRRLIFDKINYEFNSGSVYGLAGKNGSGKSTLAKIIAGILSPTRGKVIHKHDDNLIAPENLHDHLGFVSPYLVLYNEFTAGENLAHFTRIRGNRIDEEKINFWLDKFNLYDRRNDQLNGFSSGMKQRMKIIFALLHEPQLIIFDEPTSNLDVVRRENLANAFRAIDIGKEEVTEHWYDQLFLVSHDVAFTEVTDQIIVLE